MTLKKIDFAIQGVFADLNQRTHDAAFLRDFPPSGSFQKRQIKGRDYWYYYGYDRLTGERSTKYVGPDNDAVRRRVESFHELKADYKSRSDAVDVLVGTGFPQVDFFTGSVVDGLAKAGVFRVRGVLVGTVAFNCYPGLVGAVPARSFQTGDVDFAQDHGISISLNDRTEPIMEALRGIDPTFRPVPSLGSPNKSSQFINGRNFKVEFLVPNRGSDDYSAELTTMPALDGAAAQPLRYLDFLIQETVRATLMHEAGVAVVVPAPARYAVHKMIVGVSRKDEEKRGKDLAQASFLISALAESGPDRLSKAWVNAWQRGPSWREHLNNAFSRLPTLDQEKLKDSAMRYAHLSGVEPSQLVEAGSFRLNKPAPVQRPYRAPGMGM